MIGSLSAVPGEPRLASSSVSDALPHHLATLIGQPDVQTLNRIGPLEMIQPKEIHQGGLQIIDVNWSLHGRTTDLVGLAINCPGLTVRLRHRSHALG